MSAKVRLPGDRWPSVNWGALWGAAIMVYGRPINADEPSALVVTEGRIKYPDYASCGDGVSWLFEKGNVAVCSMQNRESICGEWEPGHNIERWRQWGSVTAPVNVGDPIVLARPKGNHIGLYLGKLSSWQAVAPAHWPQSVRDKDKMVGVPGLPIGDDFAMAMLSLLASEPGRAFQWHPKSPPTPQELGTKAGTFLTLDYNGYGRRMVVTARRETPLWTVPITANAGAAPAVSHGYSGPPPSWSGDPVRDWDFANDPAAQRMLDTCACAGQPIPGADPRISSLLGLAKAVSTARRR